MSDPDLRVRDAYPDERPAIRHLTLAAYEEYAAVMEPSAWEGLRQAVISALESEEPADRIVAEREGLLVGSVMLFPAARGAPGGSVPGPSWPELRVLAVPPEERGSGIGRVLVDECVRRARLRGAAELGLFTSRSLAAAIRMYESMGFVRAPEHDFRPAGAELVTAYRLPLTSAQREANPNVSGTNPA
jgi:predicted N-acetyltransferase YhbS